VYKRNVGFLTDQPTVLIREGNAINVSESSEIRLTCDVDAKPAAGRVEWYRGK